MAKGKCKYCGIELKDIANIRCDKCDMVWQEGSSFGRNEIRSKLKEVFRALNNLSKEE